MAIFMNKEIHVFFNLYSGLQNQESKTVKNQSYFDSENPERKKTQVQGSSANFIGVKNTGEKEVSLCQKITKN